MTDETVTVSLPQELLVEIERLSLERGVSVSALAAEALRRFSGRRAAVFCRTRPVA